MKVFIAKGGLGNQFFQVSFALYTKQKTDKVVILTGLLNSYKAKRAFMFEEGCKSSGIIVNNSKVIALVFRYTCFFFNLFFPRLFYLENSYSCSNHRYITMSHYYDAYLQNINDMEYFDFIFRNKLYRDFLRVSLLNNSSEEYLGEKKEYNIIHIRGGDLRKIYSPNEVSKLAALLKENILKNSFNGTPLKIITDDIEYAKSIFSRDEDGISFQSSNMMQDFFDISQAKYLGILDSTFSVFAYVFGLLNGSKSKLLASQRVIGRYPILTYLKSKGEVISIEN